MFDLMLLKQNWQTYRGARQRQRLGTRHRGGVSRGDIEGVGIWAYLVPAWTGSEVAVGEVEILDAEGTGNASAIERPKARVARGWRGPRCLGWGKRRGRDLPHIVIIVDVYVVRRHARHLECGICGENYGKSKQRVARKVGVRGVVEGQAGRAMRKQNDEVKVLEEELHRERPAAREQSLQDREGRLGPNGDQVGP